MAEVKPLLFVSPVSDLCFRSSSGTLCALNSLTGLPSITYPSSPSPITSLTTNASMNYVLYGSRSGHLTCLASKTGALYYTAPLADPPSPVPFLVCTDALLYACTDSGVVKCLWIHDRSEVWRASVRGRSPGGMELQGGELLLAMAGGEIYQL